jgi:hypothetical protein
MQPFGYMVHFDFPPRRVLLSSTLEVGIIPRALLVATLGSIPLPFIAGQGLHCLPFIG